ncbi:DNA binding domain-containing protein, excisionase family [Flavobacterium gillisiae]|uniref:DNA binding domain-containing protein, excisionase family n=2 Tax=Flavobacterium gillisiae TaxID=150146 RepID=A0A1H4GDM0_9FLAO|nr:DNA binding domain-containing protein, excisionase family [Flavobacterium gillisiae]
MQQTQFLQSFKNLQEEVKELKTLQLRVLLVLENKTPITSESLTSNEERISVKETCKIFGCSEVTLWKLRKEGKIPFTKIKGTIRFKKIDVLNYLNQKG